MPSWVAVLFMAFVSVLSCLYWSFMHTCYIHYMFISSDQLVCLWFCVIVYCSGHPPAPLYSTAVKAQVAPISLPPLHRKNGVSVVKALLLPCDMNMGRKRVQQSLYANWLPSHLSYCLEVFLHGTSHSESVSSFRKCFQFPLKKIVYHTTTGSILLWAVLNQNVLTYYFGW